MGVLVKLTRKDGIGSPIHRQIAETPGSKKGLDTQVEAWAVRDSIPIGDNLNDYNVLIGCRIEGLTEYVSVDRNKLLELIRQEPVLSSRGNMTRKVEHQECSSHWADRQSSRTIVGSPQHDSSQPVEGSTSSVALLSEPPAESRNVETIVGIHALCPVIPIPLILNGELGLGRRYSSGRLRAYGDAAVTLVGFAAGAHLAYEFKLSDKYHLGPGAGYMRLFNWFNHGYDADLLGAGLEFSRKDEKDIGEDILKLFYSYAINEKGEGINLVFFGIGYRW